MPEISIILPTKRYGGLNITFDGLGRQTYRDFEVIIIDDTPEDRSGECQRYADLYNLKVKCLRGKPNYWRSNRLICNARNTGLIHAEGELIVFMDDYIWVPPTFLQRHYETYKNTPFCLIGQSWACEYQEQLPSEKPLDIRTREDGRTTQRAEWPDCLGGWFYCQNASAPLEKIIEINGFDEEFDLTLEEDIDLGQRLTRVGARFLFKGEPDVTAYHVEHGIPWMTPQEKRYNEDKLHKAEDVFHAGIMYNEEPGPDEVQFVYKYPANDGWGSWALLKRNKERPPNSVNKSIFNLKEEREKIGKWT